MGLGEINANLPEGDLCGLTGPKLPTIGLYGTVLFPERLDVAE
jgi:hypothetical protein